jgi:hypothetical protein
MEKQGSFQFPPVTVQWWNPYAEKIFDRSLPSNIVNVAANPNLGMISTLKDSLNKTTQPPIRAKAKSTGPLLIAGILWYWAVLIGLAFMISFYLLIRIFIKALNEIKAIRKNYLASESYFFRKLISVNGNLSKQIRFLYHWWDRSKYNKQASTITSLAEKENNTGLLSMLNNSFEKYYGENAAMAPVNKSLKSEIKKLRSDKLNTISKIFNKISSEQTAW